MKTASPNSYWGECEPQYKRLAKNKPGRIWFPSHRQWAPSLSLCHVGPWIIFTPRQHIGAPGTRWDAQEAEVTWPNTTRSQACGKTAAIHHARGHPSPRLLDLRQPLWDLSQPPGPGGTSWWQRLPQMYSKSLEIWTPHTHKRDRRLAVITYN